MHFDVVIYVLIIYFFVIYLIVDYFRQDGYVRSSEEFIS